MFGPGKQEFSLHSAPELNVLPFCARQISHLFLKNVTKMINLLEWDIGLPGRGQSAQKKIPFLEQQSGQEWRAYSSYISSWLSVLAGSWVSHLRGTRNPSVSSLLRTKQGSAAMNKGCSGITHSCWRQNNKIRSYQFTMVFPAGDFSPIG